jgi:hypothetical protein
VGVAFRNKCSCTIYLRGLEVERPILNGGILQSEKRTVIDRMANENQRISAVFGYIIPEVTH